MTNLISPKETLILNEDGQDVITTEQELGSDFWQDLQEAKDDWKMRADGYTSVASIPTSLVNQWIRQGFDFWNAPANEITKRLRLEGYEQFITCGNFKFDR